MKRRAWRLVAACGWVLALAGALAAWASGRRELVVWRDARGAGSGADVRLAVGMVWVAWRPAAPRRPAWAGQVSRLGFRYTRWSDGSGQVGAPAWTLPAAIGAAAAGATALARGRRRVAPGSCPRCGYDLRATPDRCPECGWGAGGGETTGEAGGRGSRG